ncbi:hypothetical protein [Actinomyces bowdenii]|uniref:Uncharacterized protein n=1 Tax=Actinomyces bowdenii TaxID=131109 RepID=A0A3P1VAV4_9ACTO|nr:hypothetical protein [Actinomyces bowdenii]RRD29713.1 hypothetical protein EII10_05225 [Actinomyces bowdenii]
MNSALTVTSSSTLGGVDASAPVERDEAARELLDAHAELDSLGSAASPSRLERALERLAAAEHMMALAA